eukprot:s1777_g7.t1
MQEEVADLREQVLDLSSEARDLSAGLAALRDQVQRLERRADRAAAAARSSVSRGSSEANEEDEFSARGVQSPGSVPPRSPSVASATPTPGGQTVPNWIQREAIADQIGQFLLRALSGDHRSSSGRDLIPLSSRIWVVVQDIEGNRFNPVRVLRSWTKTKALVKRGSDAGDSIFVGLPSEREARRAVHSAHLLWPDIVEQ